MVTITNGARTTVVSRGVFEECYKPMGWEICDKSKENSQVEEVVESNEKSPENEPEQANEKTSEAPQESSKEEEATESAEEVVEAEAEPEVVEEPEEEEVETPISEMNLQELKAYAAEHNIDISAAKKRRDVLDIIKAEMEA